MIIKHNQGEETLICLEPLDNEYMMYVKVCGMRKEEIQDDFPGMQSP